jgi:SAM-dependent methyltransferase
MIAIARRRAGDRANVEFAVGDLESLDYPPGSFDVVLSRWGLMFAVDPVATFRALAKLLVPGGTLAAAVWSGESGAVPMMGIGYQVLASRLDLPPAPPGAPGPFSMGDPERLRGRLRDAGFADVGVSSFTVPFVLDSAERYVAFNKAASPPGLKDMVRERYGDEDDPETWDAIGEAVAPYRRPDGRIALPSEALLVRAVVAGG